MTPMQHRAVLVCILCVLAVLLTFGSPPPSSKKEEPAPSALGACQDGTAAPGEDLSGHYQIDNASTALLTETADAGTDYLNDTLFLGDSNTVRLYNNGLISLQQFCAKEASAPRWRSARASLPLRRTPTTTPSLRRWP